MITKCYTSQWQRLQGNAFTSNGKELKTKKKKKKPVVLSNYHRAVVKYLIRPQSLLGAELEGYVMQMLCSSHLLVGEA